MLFYDPYSIKNLNKKLHAGISLDFGFCEESLLVLYIQEEYISIP
jgi:hypothetical protein